MMTLHLISHTHWDREWFLPSAYTREWLPAFFDALFALLDRRPDYRFTLDGQTILIEDYLDLLESGTVSEALKVRDPERAKALLKEHAAAGRIRIGPYYLQPDWNLVSGEALVRNLEIGHADARLYAEPMQIGWLLDNFGQIGQCPQIHQGFDISNVMFWRGLELPPHDVSTELVWSGPDGSQVSVAFLLDSYRNAMQLLPYPEILEKRIRYAAARGVRFSRTGHVLLMNGYDQEIYPENVLPALEQLRERGIPIHQVHPEDFFAAANGAAKVDRIPETHGEQYNGRYISVFPGVLSARVYLKQANHRAETLVQRYLEPLAMHRALTGTPFPSTALDALWRHILCNHPHDSICGVSVDPVHTDMEYRFQTIQERAAELLWCRLSDRPSPPSESAGGGPTERQSSAKPGEPSAQRAVVYNPSAERRSAVITVPLLESTLDTEPAQPEALAFGGSPLPVQLLPEDGLLAVLVESMPPTSSVTFDVLSGRRHKGEALDFERTPRATGGNFSRVTAEQRNGTDGGAALQNNYLRVSVAGDGTVAVRNREDGRTYRGLLCFEDRGDVGDTYSYCPPREDQLILSNEGAAAEVELVAAGPLRAICRITQVLHLPAESSRDRSSRSSSTAAVPVVTELTLDCNSRYLCARVLVRNRARDHRLRVLFPRSGDTVITGAPFDAIERPTTPKQYSDDEIPADLSKMLLGAREPDPITTLPFRDFVAVGSETGGLAVLTRGLYEYEYLIPAATGRQNSGALALTLFRSVGWLARTDLTSRIGDAGPLIATPDAQCLRDMVFELALCPYSGRWHEAGIPALADHYQTPPLVAHDDPTGASVPYDIPAAPAPDDTDSPSNASRAAGEPGFLVEVDSPNQTVRTSTITADATSWGVLVRLYNPSPVHSPARLSAGFALSGARRTALDQKHGVDLTVNGNMVTLELAPHAIATVILFPAVELTAQNEGARSPHESTHPSNDVPPISSGYDAPALRILGVFPVTEPLAPGSTVAPPAALTAYPQLPAVTPGDLKSERRRLSALRETLGAQREELAECEQHDHEDALSEASSETRTANPETQELRAELSTLERTTLEAELSLKMLELKRQQTESGLRLPEPHDEQTREFFREIGYRLNQARIRKRTDDYLCAMLSSDHRNG